MHNLASFVAGQFQTLLIVLIWPELACSDIDNSTHYQAIAVGTKMEMRRFHDREDEKLDVSCYVGLD